MSLRDWWISRRERARELATLREDAARFQRVVAALRGAALPHTQAEGPFRALVEHASDFIGILNREGTFRYKSPSVTRQLGYTGEDLFGRGVSEFVHSGDLERVREAFRQASAQPGSATVVRCRFRHQDGSWRQLEATVTNLLDNPDVSGIVINARDITSQILLEDQLRQSQKLEALGQLSSGLAHDFNNILSVILANTELIARGLPPAGPDFQTGLDDIRHAATAGADMIRKLMGFCRQADLAADPTDLGTLVTEFSRLLQRLLPESIHVEVTVNGPLPPSLVDRTAVEQILLNLATNARDAMPGGGMLHVGVDHVVCDSQYVGAHPWVQPGDYVCVTVSDTGVGMDEAGRARIFDPFFTSKPSGKGTGLGMAMVYGLVQQHRGHIHVYSEPSRGTRISIYFPVAKGARRPTGARRSVAVLEGGSEVILLVEDDEALRRAGKCALESFGYQVLTAENGERALDVFDRHGTGIDIVISDLVMPKLSGSDLYAELKRRRPDICFVFASGYAARQAAESFELPDVPRFLTKPWTLNELASAVRGALDEARAASP